MASIKNATKGVVIKQGRYRTNLLKESYQPADITPYGIVCTDGFFKDKSGQWKSHNKFISVESYGNQALIWMDCPKEEGQYFQADGSASTTLTDSTIGTIVQRHGAMCELFLNIVPIQETTNTPSEQQQVLNDLVQNEQSKEEPLEDNLVQNEQSKEEPLEDEVVEDNLEQEGIISL